MRDQKMFCVYNEHEEIQAFHKKLDVVKKYVKSISSYDHGDMQFFIIKKKRTEINPSILNDLYLIPYGESYIQQGYTDYLELATDSSMNYLKDCIDCCFQLYKRRDLDTKEKKVIYKAIEIMVDIYDKDTLTVPTLSELKRMKELYQPYTNYLL